ncbi:hypothetical protein EB74_11425 [Mycobacterium sp. SWH-M5]|nr:hypothetical protein EB74_11425 [Mycobacterium sp. SWH-M5]
MSNKKTELDERYDQLSADFQEYHQQSLEFLDLLGILEATVKWQGQTRWSNIVDLFTLLHVCWGLRDQIAAATPEQLAKLRVVLDLFQRAVSSHKREEGSDQSNEQIASLAKLLAMSSEQVTKVVSGYISGIRNSSDLGSRRTRSSGLSEIVSRALVPIDPEHDD